MSQVSPAVPPSPDTHSFPLQVVFDVVLAIMLCVGLFGVYWFDRLAPEVAVPDLAAEPESIIEPELTPPPLPKIEIPEETLPPIDPTRRIQVAYRSDLRFGVRTTSGNPDDSSDDNKRLTYSERGNTNNTRASIDGYTPLFGGDSGRITQSMTTTGDRLESEWLCRNIRFRQTVEYVAGDVSRRIDTLRVEYRMDNDDSRDHDVGIRVMIDSLIGNNDGVPFIVPGRQEIVTTPQLFRDSEIPNFIRALEAPNLVQPGVITDLGMNMEGSEAPSEVILTHWPGSDAEWDYDRDAAFGSDTAIGLFYAPRRLPPGGTRTVGFSYGLGTISSTRTKNARLSLTAGGPFRAGGQFWIVALVQNPKAGQRVRLELPAGFRLGNDDAMAKEVTKGSAYAQLSWLVAIAPSAFGKRNLQAVLEPDNISESYEVTVQPRDAQIVIILGEHPKSGKPFWVSALIRNAQDGQSVDLSLPDEFKLHEGYSKRRSISQKEGYSRIDWLVDTPSNTAGEFEISVELRPDGIAEKVSLQLHAGSLID